MVLVKPPFDSSIGAPMLGANTVVYKGEFWIGDGSIGVDSNHLLLEGDQQPIGVPLLLEDSTPLLLEDGTELWLEASGEGGTVLLLEGDQQTGSDKLLLEGAF